MAFYSQLAKWNNFALMPLSGGVKCYKCLEHSWWYCWAGVLIRAHRYATSFSSSLVSLRKVKASDEKCSFNTDGRGA